MKLKLAIILGKLANRLSKLLGKNGTVIGGKVALKIDKTLLKKIKYPEFVIGVTGSTGKTSLTELTNFILTKNGYKVAFNNSGSNVVNGIAALVIENTKLNGIMDKDVLLMELDEKNVKHVIKHIKPTHLLITNLQRDQLVREGHPEITFESIKENISDDTALILNADDSLVIRYSVNHKGKCYYYGLDKTIYSTTTPLLENKDASYCPICNSKLKYKFYHYNHLGDYKCSKCSFKKPKLNYIGTDIDLKKQKMNIDKNKVSLPSNFLYSAYFTLGAYAICNIIGLSKDKIINTLNNEELFSKRKLVYKFNNNTAEILLSKNETNASYEESLRYLKTIEKKKTVVMGFDSVSRRYKENDISWLYDIEFEMLNDAKVSEIVLYGRFRYDILTRLNYANIDTKITILETKEEVIPYLKQTKNNIYFVVYFDMASYFEKQIKEDI